MEKKEPTVEQLQKEIAEQKRINEMVAKEAMINARVVKMLVAAGFVTEKKVDEAHALISPMS